MPSVGAKLQFGTLYIEDRLIEEFGKHSSQQMLILSSTSLLSPRSAGEVCLYQCAESANALSSCLRPLPSGASVGGRIRTRANGTTQILSLSTSFAETQTCANVEASAHAVAVADV